MTLHTFAQALFDACLTRATIGFDPSGKRKSAKVLCLIFVHDMYLTKF